MTISLERGANTSLTDLTTSNKFFLGLNWLQKPSSEININTSCFMLNGNCSTQSSLDFIFYNNSIDANQAITLTDKLDTIFDKSGFIIDLSKIPEWVDKLVFCLSIDNSEGDNHCFGELDFVFCRIIDYQNNEEIAEFNCTNSFDKETSIIVSEIYRYNGKWKFKAIAQGYSNGIATLISNFGINVNDIDLSSHTNDDQAISRKARKSQSEVIDEQIALIRKKMKPILLQVNASLANGINESNTRLVLDRIFQDVLGYSIDEIKTEQKIQGRAADYVLSPNGNAAIVIEAKKAGAPLKPKQIFQATSYAAYSGIQWAILTNLVDWQFYKVSTVDKVDPHLVFTIHLSSKLDDENSYNLMLISRFSVLRKNLIEKVWLKNTCLRQDSLIGAILNDEVISKIRYLVTKENGGKVTNEEVKKAIETDILRL